MIKLEGVSKSFGEHRVVDDLDLTVTAGERVALIGASGSGKSTILRMLIGLERPDAGTIEIGGCSLWHERGSGGAQVAAKERHIRKVRRQVGIVFQQFNLFPHMTALENVIEAPRHALGLSRADAIARGEELLTLVGLGDRIAHRPHQLSGGQQQRVAIARALALEPKVMLFDEVTSALDPELVGEVLRCIYDLAHKFDMTMLVVTHEMRFAADIAQRVLMFDKGKIIEDGPPLVVLKTPREERTQQFLRAILERE
jgi:polar amino acid transport system ATP-binding protein